MSSALTGRFLTTDDQEVPIDWFLKEKHPQPDSTYSMMSNVKSVDGINDLMV